MRIRPASRTRPGEAAVAASAPTACSVVPVNTNVCLGRVALPTASKTGAATTVAARSRRRVLMIVSIASPSRVGGRDARECVGFAPRGRYGTFLRASTEDAGCIWCHAAAVSRSLLVIDDHASFRALARQVLDCGIFRVVGEAATAAEGMAMVRALHPDVVI